MAGMIRPITDQERIERRDRVARAVASVRLEGLEPTEAARAIFYRYMAGDLTTQEMAAEIRALNARQFGPIHVSGD
jgi:Antitoxin VbhA